MKRATSEVPEPPAAAPAIARPPTYNPPRLRTPRRPLTHLGHASQHGVAALLAFRPPPPLQEVLVRSGLHPGKAGQHRIRAALVARGPLPHHHLYAMARLPGLMQTQLQYPRLGRETGARAPYLLLFLPDGAVQLFIPLTEVSRHLLIRPGEIRLPLLRHLLGDLGLVHLPHPPPPSVPRQPMDKLVGIMGAEMSSRDRNRMPRDIMIGQEGAAVVI
jgi:hypothetical protein